VLTLRRARESLHSAKQILRQRANDQIKIQGIKQPFNVNSGGGNDTFNVNVAIAGEEQILAVVASFWGFGALLSLAGILFGVCRLSDPQQGKAARRGLWLNMIALLGLLVPTCILRATLSGGHQSGTFQKVK
jgi:hypothetical protein